MTLPDGIKSREVQKFKESTTGETAIRVVLDPDSYAVLDARYLAGSTGGVSAHNLLTNLEINNAGHTVSATDKVLGRKSSGSGVVEEIDCTDAGRKIIASNSSVVGVDAISAGNYNFVNGDQSVSVGAGNITNDIASTCVGYSNTVETPGEASTCVGGYNYIEGDNSIVIGSFGNVIANRSLLLTATGTTSVSTDDTAVIDFDDIKLMGDTEVSGTITGSNLSGTNSGDQTITLTGDVTGSGTGSFVATIANDAVTYAKMQNVSATDKILGRASAGSGDVEEITCTSFARSILDDADEATFKATVNLEIGTDVQAYNSKLTDIAGLTATDSNIIVGNGTTWVAESGATARTSLGLGTGDSPQFTGVNIGHASDTTLARVSAGVISVEGTAIPKGTGTANQIAYWSGTNVVGALAVATYPSLTELSYVKGVSSAIQTQLGGKQATLVSGTNIKTVNSNSLLGSGDVAVQPTLVSGTNIKTINSTTLLGSGDIAITPNATHTGEVTGDTALTVDKSLITNKTETTNATDDFVLFSDTSDSGNLKKCKPINLRIVSGADTGNIPWVNNGLLAGDIPLSTDGTGYIYLGDTYAVGQVDDTVFDSKGWQTMTGLARPWKEVGCWLFPKEGVSSFTNYAGGGFDAPPVGYGFGGLTGSPYYKMVYDSELTSQTRIPFEIKIPDDYILNTSMYWHVHFSLEPDAVNSFTGNIVFNVEYVYAEEQLDCNTFSDFSTADQKIASCTDLFSPSTNFPHMVTNHDDTLDQFTSVQNKNGIIRGFISLHGNTTYGGVVIPIKIELDYRAGELGQFNHREVQ